ncbi:MAG TPA: hypothetical protein VHV77_10805, partial [Pirellulales bacterium]|nr:hypothetical protein [Pirellulales bacterium]
MLPHRCRWLCLACVFAGAAAVADEPPRRDGATTADDVAAVRALAQINAQVGLDRHGRVESVDLKRTGV